jgi:putative (di)nucleoside polyphosphate hydrolase
MRFLGTDSDINLNTLSPEFKSWKWIDPSILPLLTVDFKKTIYKKVVKMFGPYLK